MRVFSKLCESRESFYMKCLGHCCLNLDATVSIFMAVKGLCLEMIDHKMTKILRNVVVGIKKANECLIWSKTINLWLCVLCKHKATNLLELGNTFCDHQYWLQVLFSSLSNGMMWMLQEKDNLKPISCRTRTSSKLNLFQRNNFILIIDMCTLCCDSHCILINGISATHDPKVFNLVQMNLTKECTSLIKSVQVLSSNEPYDLYRKISFSAVVPKLKSSQ